MNSLYKTNPDLFSLNYSLYQKLKSYLSQKQLQIANSILHKLFPKQMSECDPILNPANEVNLLSFVDFIENYRLEIDQKDLWQVKIPAINQELWRFLQLIEGNIVELFQRIQFLEILDWTEDLFLSVMDISNLLLAYVDDLILSIEKLETILQKIKVEDSYIFRFYKPAILDKKLLQNLFYAENSLKKNTEKFQKKFESLSELNALISKKARKFKGYQSFSSLDKEHRNQFINIYKLVKLWEENKTKPLFARLDFLKATKQSAPIGKSYLLLKLYLNSILKHFFHTAEEWRIEKAVLNLDNMDFLEKELNSLRGVIERYREMLLGIDPNPYVRSRLGFKEWIVGPEPKKSKDLLELIYQCEELRRLFEKFRKSIQTNSEEDPQSKNIRLNKEIHSIIHEMGQPLASRTLIRARADKLLDLIDECDELAGSAGHVESLITDSLLKAFQIDWHYQVLVENPKFQKIWLIHSHAEKPERDFVHEKRMVHFRRMVHEIEKWVKEHETLKHIHDIETIISDTQEQLQEYLSHVKRQLSAQEGIERSLFKEKIKLQVLVYYELFDRFLLFLRTREEDGKILLNQFQFIDQYLEAVLAT